MMRRRSVHGAALAALAAIAVLSLSSALVVASPGSGISPPSARGDGVISGRVNVNTPNVVQLRTYADLRVFDDYAAEVLLCAVEEFV